MIHYALYKGDTFLDIGTAEQLAEKFNLSPNFIKWAGCPSAVKRYAGRGYITVKVDDEPNKRRPK